MAFLEIKNSGPLQGRIMLQGSKNAALPMLAASLLCSGKTLLRHVPGIYDVFAMTELLTLLGCRITRLEDSLEIDAGDICCYEISRELMKKMRSSIILLAPLLVRTGRAVVTQPGGCSIGERPVDIHLYALERLGARLNIEGDRIEAEAERLTGCSIELRFPSVGATEQTILAACTAEGTTCLTGAAREPEIVQLCRMLNSMGADIKGAGTSVIIINGRKNLRETDTAVQGDRITAATYMAAAAVCGGNILLDGIESEHLEGIIRPFDMLGCRTVKTDTGISFCSEGRPKAIPYLKTQPYPGFPTDAQSLFLSVLSTADGQSVVEEGIFPERFRTALQLQKMGADIIIEKNHAVIRGGSLHGETVSAPDLRGGAALAVAGLAAAGTTEILGYEHIARGYENLAGDLRELGANSVYLHGELI